MLSARHLFDTNPGYRWQWFALAVAALGVVIGFPGGDPRAVALIAPPKAAVALVPVTESVPNMTAIDFPVSDISALLRSAKLPKPRSGVPPLKGSAVLASLPDRPEIGLPPMTVSHLSPTLLMLPACAPATPPVSPLFISRCPKASASMRQFGYSNVSPIMNALSGGRDGKAGGVSRLRLALLPPNPPVLTRPPLPASIELRIEQSGVSVSKTIVGVASMYDPADPTDRTSGGWQTASGELYNRAAWTAAIRTDLRERFGGIGFGKHYRPTYALIAAARKRVIVKINDVGPLVFGRVIDLNRKVMRYFDPSLQLGLIRAMHVIPLPGTHWIAGPIGQDGQMIRLAGEFEP